MGNLNEFFRDLGRNAYGLGENVASLGSAAIAEPVAGFAAFDPLQRQSSNLLAQSAKLAPAATLGALMANEKRKEKRN